MNFKSQRLQYRLFTEQDYYLFKSIFSNEEVMKYAWIDKIDNEENMQKLFSDFLNRDEELNKFNSFAYAVFLQDKNIFIGFADIVIQGQNSYGGCGEIGYFLLPEFWGNGFATEIANTLTELGFTKMGLHKICARCDSNNVKSENVMKKVGMTKEGELKQVRLKSGIWDDEKHYGILIDEWRKV